MGQEKNAPLPLRFQRELTKMINREWMIYRTFEAFRESLPEANAPTEERFSAWQEVMDSINSLMENRFGEKFDRSIGVNDSYGTGNEVVMWIDDIGLLNERLLNLFDELTELSPKDFSVMVTSSNGLADRESALPRFWIGLFPNCVDAVSEDLDVLFEIGVLDNS